MSTTLNRPGSSTRFDSASQRTPPASSGLGKLFLALLVLAVLAGGGYLAVKQFVLANGGPDPDYVLYQVKKQDMDILVAERGSLESGVNKDLVCEVEARSPGGTATSIIWIIKEGTQVTKGEKLVELESAALKDSITSQQIKVEQARSSLLKEETNLDITRSQNDSDIQAAQIAVELAEIDLKKYLEGDYQQEKRNIDGEVLIADEELKRAEERLDYSAKLSKKNYVSTTEVEADKLAVTKSKNSRDVAREKLRVLEEFMMPRTKKDLTSKLDEGKRKLDRVRGEAKAKEAQANSTMLTQKSTTTTEENTLKRLERQLDKCTLYAPTDGMVVYANDASAMFRGQPQVQIEEGASIRERQKIIRIPDLNSMLVNVKVHEAKVAHVLADQRAEIVVESMPDKTFSGTVKLVATTADAQSWMTSGVQVFTVMVSIDEAVEGLKPGMTANVKITADRLTGVLAVPVQAVVERERQNYCYVLEPGSKIPVPRRVEIGATNDKIVEIKKHLNEGEKILENLTAVIDEESLGEIAKADAEKYKIEKPPTPVVAKTKVARPATGNGNGSPAASGTGPSDAAGVATKGGGGGGGSRMLEQYDKNKDGKITLADEVPEDRRAFLTRLDTNSDGVVDSAELAALAARGRQGGGQGGGFGNFRMPENGADYIKQNDKNSDGKVAKDELPEFVQGFFDRIDTNGDGFVDEAEAEVTVQQMKERMKAMQEGGGGFGGPGGPGGAGGAVPKGGQQ